MVFCLSRDSSLVIPSACSGTNSRNRSVRHTRLVTQSLCRCSRPDYAFPSWMTDIPAASDHSRVEIAGQHLYPNLTRGMESSGENAHRAPIFSLRVEESCALVFLWTAMSGGCREQCP